MLRRPTGPSSCSTSSIRSRPNPAGFRIRPFCVCGHHFLIGLFLPMRIVSVRVSEFGTIEDLEIDLTDGLNVISGPNETGKSTLMKAIWFALTRRCTSQAREIREIVPNRGGTPEVEVHLRANGTTYELKKVFDGQSGQVSLRVDHSERGIDDYTGEEADEVIREALGFGKASGRTGVPEHFGFWPAVWVGQEESEVDPGRHVTAEGNPESISSVLAQIGGDVLAGSGADVVEKAREKYREFYTESGSLTERSGAPLHEAKKRRDDAEERFEELKQTRDRYEDDLDDHERLQQEIVRIDEQLPELRKEAEEADEEFERVQEIRDELQTEEAELKSAESEVDQLEDRLDRRTSLRENIGDLEAEKEEKEEEIGQRKEALDAHREDRDELAEAKEEAEQTRDELKRQERRLRAHLDVLRAQERLERIESRIDELGDLVNERDELRAKVAGISVEEDDIEQLESLKEERDQAQTRLETAAAQLRITAEGDVDLRIGDEDFSLSEGEGANRRIDEPTRVDVDSRLQIRIEPGGEDLALIRETAQETQEAYDDALSDLGIESLAEVRSQYQRKDRLSTRLESVEGQIDDLMPEGEEDLDEAKIQAKAAVDAAKEKRETHTEGDRDDSLPTEEEAVHDRLEEVEDALEEAKEDVDEAREAVQDHDAETQELQKKLQKAETQAEGIWESLRSAREDLQQHEDEYGPDEKVQEALAEAKEEMKAKKETVEGLQSELEELNPEELEARKERTEDALEMTIEEKDTLNEELNKIRGRLESEDLRGLHGRLEEARQKLEEAQADVDRLQRQAEAAKLLYETLTESRAEARKKYLAPLREEVEQLLDRFFDAEECSVEFGEEFDLQQLSRSSDGSFAFDQLSTGAKQQLSVLVRLAMARLIARERPHPVFLDDALSDTDPERFEAIANILRSAAREMQVILTTCHHDRHRRLGVETMRMEALKHQAR